MMTDRVEIGDAFGTALLEELEHGNAFEVAERDDGFVGVHPIARYFAEYSDWPELEKVAIDSASGRVLDLGAGAGRATLTLQQRNQSVLAVYNSPLAVQVCRRRGVQNIVLGTIFDLPPQQETFDSVLMLGGNLGFLQGPSTARAFLIAAASVTSPSARIFGISTDPYLSLNPTHLAYYKRNFESGRVGGQMRLRIRHGIRATVWFDLWLLSVPDLQQVVANTDWNLGAVQRDGARYLATLTRC
ncbi:class I SAM-dependent methyltransferase [Nocardia sp. NPDC050789]